MQAKDARNRLRAELRSAGEDDVTVAVVLLPRNLWRDVTVLGSSYRENIRCGPHITMIDPCIKPELLQPKLLAEELRLEFEKRNLREFDVTLKDLDLFKHPSGSATVWIKPETDNNELIVLQDAMLSLIPKCNRVNTISVDKKFHPHVTIAKFDTSAEALATMPVWQKLWKPQKFTVTDIALLSRYKNDPYEIVSLAPLSGDKTTQTVSYCCPSLMPQLNKIKLSNENICRTLRVCPASDPTVDCLVEHVEHLINSSSGTPRDVSLWLFASSREMFAFLDRTNHPSHVRYEPLATCAYPDIIDNNSPPFEVLGEVTAETKETKSSKEKRKKKSRLQ